MKYLKLKFLLIFAALAMAIPPAWAETTVEFDFTENNWGIPEGNSNNITQGENSYTYNGYTITLNSASGSGYSTHGYYYNSTSNFLMMCRSSARLTLPAFSKVVTKIEVICNSGGNVSTNATQNIFLGNTNTPVSTETKSAGTHEYLINANYQDIGTVYSLKQTANYNAQVKKVIVYLQEEAVTTPTIMVGSSELDINQDGGSFTVTGRNLIDNIGVNPSTGFSTIPDPKPSENEYWGFVNNNGSVDGTVTVNYVGRPLNATGTVTMGTKPYTGAPDSEDITEEVTVNFQYDGDIYVLGNFGNQGWNFNDASHKMTPNNGIYTTRFTVPANSWLIFSKALSENGGLWNESYFGAPDGNDNGNWEVRTERLGNDYSIPSNSNYCLYVSTEGEYIFTVYATTNKFKIEKVEPIGNVCPAVIEFESASEDSEDAFNDDLETFLQSVTAGANYIQSISSTRAYAGKNGIKISSSRFNGTLTINLKPLNGNGSWRTTKVIVNAIPYSSSDGASFELNDISSGDLSADFADYEFNLDGSEIQSITIDAVKRIYVKSITIMHECGDEPILDKVATPTFNPAEGEKDGVIDVTISCATNGATIYYTLDGSEPTSSSNVYGDPIHLTTTTTVKAIAMKDGMENSAPATAEYTLPRLVTTIADAMNESDPKFIFDAEAVVTFQNGSHLYIRQGEASGQIFGSNVGTFTNGDVLNKEWSAKYELYEQYTPEFTSPKNVSLKENNGAVAPLTLTTLTLDDVNKYAAISGVTITDIEDVNYYFTVGETKYCLRRAYTELVPDALLKDKTYDVEGVVVVFNGAPQLNLTKATLIKQDPGLAFSSETVNATYGAAFTAPELTKPEDLTATISYVSNNTNVATVDQNTGAVTIVGVGNAKITASSTETTYYLAGEAFYNIVVTAATPTFAYSAETKEVVFGAENPELPTLNNPNGLTVSYTSTNTAVATVANDGVVTIVGAGTTTIKATGAATGNYSGAEAQYTLTVNKADLEVSFDNGTPDPITIGDDFTAPTLSEVPEGVTVTYKSSNENVAKVNATTGEVEIVGVGTAVITATVTGDNYNETSASYTITVNDVVEAIAAPTFSPAAGTYTEPKQVAIACATPGVTIEYSFDGTNFQAYNEPFTVGNENGNSTVTVTARAKMGNRTVYTPASAEAEYIIKPAPAAAIADDYYYMQNNELSDKYANVAGRRTLNFVADADKQAGTVFRIETGEDGAVKTLRSQAVDLQDYAKRAMAYVGPVVQMVVNKLNNADDIDDVTGAGEILGQNGLGKILEKFNECFDYNLYVEGTEGAYRIYARTPSMQHVVDFYNDPENNAQIKAKLPDLEGYINQVLDKIRAKVESSGMNGEVIEEFSLVKVWEKMGGTLIKPVKGDNAAIMAFYDQVLTNKEYVWDFAYQTAMIYLDNIKGTGTYEGIPAEYKAYIDKMQRIRPETKYYMIQYGNEPDYVSENNVKIINGDASTYWTLTPRVNFTVNVPEANKLNDSYYTTLYTDFAYSLPTDVKAYAVTSIDANDVAQLAEITGTIPAQTPVLLKATAAGDKELTLKTDSRSAIDENLLVGPDYLVKTFGITSPTVEMLFNMAAGFVPAETLADYEYLKLRTSGTVNNKYFWNVNDALDSCTYKDANNEDDCVVRSLAVKNGTLAFSEHWTTENNKAFLVSDTKPVIYLEKETLAAPTFSPVPGSYTVDNGESVTITITAEDGATISYSTDGGKTWQTYNDNDPITASDDMTILAKAEKDGMIASNEVTAVYVIDNPTVLPDVPAMKGYYQIKNNGNNKYANVAGRKTLNFKSEDEAKTEAGTVIWLETNGKGQVQSIRSQAADLQRYADRAMSYVPEIVNIVVNKINEMNGIEDATGAGSVLGENGLGLIMEEFNKCFDHHLYVEEADGGYRLYGKTPNMQHVVDFYREHTAQVEEKLPKLEKFINDALTILKNKIGGSSVFTEFSLHEIWEKMGSTLLPEPIEGNDAAIMDFYRTVLNNKNYVWDFAYQTAMIYLDNIKYTQTYQNLVNEHPEILQYIDKIDQIRPDFKYYVVQKNDKPDFISEGNVDIINNEGRTIWTLVPCSTFDVKIDNNQFGCPYVGGVGGYATTLYTDFAYNVPDGVTAYKVTSIKGGQATIEALSGIIPAQTPVLLTAKEAGTATLTLTTDAGTADMDGNLLYGPDYLINEYDLKTAQVQSLFEQIKAKLGQDFYNNYVAQYEYLADLNSGTVNNKYFWGLKESDVEKCSNDSGEDCVVRNLSGDKFIDNWKVETNKAFLVTDEYAEITFNTLHGDVNHDGEVNIADVTDLIDRLLGMPDPYHLKACEYCSDVNKNGTVKIDDVTTLIDILLGIDNSNQATDPQGGE